MQQITEYKIVMSQAPAELAKLINELIKEGWIPTGGVAITQSPVSKQVGDYLATETMSHQAMVKLKVF